MDNADAGGWCYTACYGWNWRSARAISSALGSLALPMPAWFRAVVARCLLTRTALHADALFIWRAVAVRRRRRRSRHPETWLDSGREDAESSPLTRLRRSRLAAWTLRVSSLSDRDRAN
jgi:hypothetical protein